MREKLHIYIVEDEKIVALDIKTHLISIGYNVIGISSSGEDCLEKLKSIKPDLILMDINLSGQLTGIETAEKINSSMNIPIVFLTAYTDDKTLKEVKKTGYYGYVTKPFKEIDLKTEIEFTIDRFNKLLKLKKETEASQTSLRDTEEFFKQVVNNVSDIIYRIDLKGYFTYVNPSAINQTGFSREELLRMKYTSLIRTDFKQKAYFFFKNIFQNKIENSYFEFPLITKSNEEIWIGQKIHLLKFNNSIVGFQVIARDITKEKEFKEQLIIAKKNAENTAQVKSQFLANMSHEIRTPLNGIIGVIHLLDKTELSEKQRTYIDAITSSSNQLLGIINDVLDLSKIEAGKMEIVKSEFDLYELVQSVISIFEIKTVEKGIDISYEINERVPHYLLGDSIRLNQILYNLIGNAVKFTENGEVKLKIDVLNETDDSCNIQFFISDSGIGMEEEVTARIFDMFTQAEEDTTRKFGGTGLGLAIVKRLVEMQGGEINVTSKLNHGSCFMFNIQYGKVKDQSHKNEVVHNDYGLLDGLNILLVEDNPINQLVTKDLLEEQHAKVVIAGNGEIALDLLKDEKYDVILMDMQMPVLDGYQTMRIIRNSEDPGLNQMPILALTANAIDTEITKCMESGADDYLSKPFKPDSLYLKVCNLISDGSCEADMSEHVDIEALEMYTNGKEELLISTLNELKKAFLTDAQSIETALENKDSKSLRSLSHKIKPNFFMIGMNKLGELCKEIEHTEDETKVYMKVKLLLNSIPPVIDEINEITHRRTAQPVTA